MCRQYIYLCVQIALVSIPMSTKQALLAIAYLVSLLKSTVCDCKVQYCPNDNCPQQHFIRATFLFLKG